MLDFESEMVIEKADNGFVVRQKAWDGIGKRYSKYVYTSFPELIDSVHRYFEGMNSKYSVTVKRLDEPTWETVTTDEGAQVIARG